MQSAPTNVSSEDQGKVRIVLADQSSMSCELLAAALNHEGGLEVISTSTDVPSLVEHVEAYRPDIALISVSLGEGATSGLDGLRELRTKQFDTLTIMLLDRSSPEQVVEAFRLGAKGIFYRNQSVDQLRRCIRVVLEGQIWANNEDWHFVFDALRTAVPVRPVDAKGEDLLTERQKELVSFVMEGFTNREIARLMNLSEHTVKNYLFRIFDKLGVSSRAELIIYSMNSRAMAEHGS